MRTKAVLVSLLVMLTVGCSGGQDTEFMLGQKLMLDMRYYCADGTPAESCKTPVTTLLPEFADIIRQGQIGGVILFAETSTTASRLSSSIMPFSNWPKRQVYRHCLLPSIRKGAGLRGCRMRWQPVMLAIWRLVQPTRCITPPLLSG